MHKIKSGWLASIVALCIYFCFNSSAQSVINTANNFAKSQSAGHVVRWNANPFDSKVFIENKGQFDNDIKAGPVLFSVQMGNSDAFFTSRGVTFRYLEVTPLKQGQDPDEAAPPKRTFHFAVSEWVGSNPAVSVNAIDEQAYYYTYPKGDKGTIKTNVFKKIVYHNLYPGIDVEYTFPVDGNNEKRDGIKYALIVHPGADLSQVKLKYSGVRSYKTDEKGDIIWVSDAGNLTDHAPVAYYEGAPGKNISVSYKVTGDEESFSINSEYDKSKTIIIDPWISDPLFSSPDNAYIMDYDYSGNVYVYGGTGYQLVKFNNAGVKQWMFNATTLSLTGPYIGGMCCDKKSQCCYMSEGWNSSGGASKLEKVNTSGILLGTDPGNPSMIEIWRLVWDPCTHFVFGSGDGTCCPDQACQIDTSMGFTTVANICAPVVNSGGYHDFGCLAMDPAGGYIYTACSQSLVYTNVFNNYLVKCPIPSLIPVSFQVPDQFAIHEWSSYTFSGNLTNGFSGAAVSPNWVYLYQGDTLKQMDKITGSINAVAKVSSTPYQWGGLAVDYCDDIYLGNSNSVQEYNPSLVLSNTIPVSGTVYDVKLNGALLYACGAGFVSAITIVPPSAPTISKTKVSAGCSKACNGSATATLTLCSNPVINGVTYLWSNGQTTQTATSLCAGTYTVTLTFGCSLVISDTVQIVGDTGTVKLNAAKTNAKCYGVSNGSAIINASGGTAPYSYVWNNGLTTSTASGLSAGSYTITVNDQSGCSGTIAVTITQPKILSDSITSTTKVGCNGGKTGAATVIGKGGTGIYTYSWAPSGGTNTNATGLSVGVYTVTVTDSNGCTAKVTDTVKQLVKPVPVITGTDSICKGGSVTLTATGGEVSYLWSNGATTSSITVPVTNTTTYTVQVSNGSCTADTIYKVTAIPLPSITFSGNTAICMGKSTVITASGGSSFTWTPSSGLSCNNCPNPTASPTVTTIYTVTASNGNCTTDTTITVTVNNPPTIKLTQPQDICSGSGVTLTATGGGTYLWSNGATTSSISVSPSSTTSYTVVVNNGCIDSASTHVTVDSPNLFVCCNDTIMKGDTVTIHSSGQGTYSWLPIDGLSCFSCPNPVASPTVTTTYTVSSTDSMGCTVERTITIYVETPCADFTVPNVFTPNNDGINDDLVIKVLNSTSYSILVYDRWGKEVFSSGDPTKYWNGRLNGTDYLVPDGVYYYIIKATCGDNNYTKKGFVQLMGEEK